MSSITDPKTYKETLLKSIVPTMIPTTVAKALVNSSGTPTHLHIWSRIFYFFLKICIPSITHTYWSDNMCLYCCRYHNEEKLCPPAFLSICRTFNLDPNIRKYLRPIAMGRNGFKTHISTIRVENNPFIYLSQVGLIKSRQGHGNSNNIFGVTWLRNNVPGQIHWEHLKLPFFFFTRQDKLTSDKGIPMPGVKIPMCYFRGANVRIEYHPPRPLIWKKSWVSTAPEEVHRKMTYLVMGSPLTLLACSRQNVPTCTNLPKKRHNTICAGNCLYSAGGPLGYVLECGHNICKGCYTLRTEIYCTKCGIWYKQVFKDNVRKIVYPKVVSVTPLAKIQAHNVCYLVYPIENNMRYWINTKTQLVPEIGPQVVNFYTNIV